MVPSNSLLTMSATRGRVYYTTDGSDPRLPAGQSTDGKIVTLLAENAPKRVLVPSVANGGNLLSNIPAGFQVTYYKATVAVDSITAAEGVIANPAQQAAVAREQARVINYFNTGSPGNFDNDRPFPGTTLNADVEDFVVLVTGKVMIPATGEWTFGVNSDDGFSMTLTRKGKTYTSSYPDPRGPGDTLTVFNITEAGSHDLRLVFYERGGGSELELFAARGNITSFSANQFRLVGDVSAGGLQVGEGNVWYANLFDDSSWTAGTGGVGYEAGTGYRELHRHRRAEPDVQHQRRLLHPHSVHGDQDRVLQHDIESPLRRRFRRLPERGGGGPPELHGRARSGTPSPPAGNADEAAMAWASFDISDYASLLWEGANLLAIHGLNTPA